MHIAIYFFPTNEAHRIDTMIATLAERWKANRNSTEQLVKGVLGFGLDGAIYFAQRTTTNGTFLLTYDSTDGQFCDEYTILKDLVEPSLDISAEHICVLYNYDEASAEDFFTWMAREDDARPLWALVNKEGLFDGECEFNMDYAPDTGMSF